MRSWLLVLFLASNTAWAEEPKSKATLPLEEIIRLYQENEAAKKKTPIALPTQATINRVELTGRLLKDAVDITARFEVAVLADDVWSTVPLLKKNSSTNIASLPPVEKGVFVVSDGYLSFVTNKRGVHELEVSLLEHANLEENKRRVKISYGDAALATLQILFDENLFHLESSAVKEGDKVIVYPGKEGFDLRWKQRGTLTKELEQRGPRPAIESVIEHAHGSTVLTLEGNQITRVLYRLQFEGTKPITFRIPAGQTLEKVFLNGAAVPFEEDDGQLRLQMTPARAGDQSGTVELLLAKDLGSFFLSGRLSFAVPGASWGINELHFDLHLPQVFAYAWNGGSLAPIESSPEVSFAHRVPTPGTKRSFHQYLIASSTPGLRIDYTVDLADQYFR